jgi:hypothetical protein
MVEVFKTNIQDKTTVYLITEELSMLFPDSRINFDLDDCDKILRVESEIVIPEEVVKILTYKGFFCEVLE